MFADTSWRNAHEQFHDILRKYNMDNYDAHDTMDYVSGFKWTTVRKLKASYIISRLFYDEGKLNRAETKAKEMNRE